jgi:hypothetical protein
MKKSNQTRQNIGLFKMRLGEVWTIDVKQNLEDEKVEKSEREKY